MDEDLWLEDGLEELFLGAPGPPAAAPPAPAKRGWSAKRAVWKTKKEDEDERLFRELLNAAMVPQAAKDARDQGRERQLAALALGREKSHIASQLAGPKMSLADKRRLEEQKILHNVEVKARRRREEEEHAKKVAMHVKMAKVRAAKRKR